MAVLETLASNKQKVQVKLDEQGRVQRLILYGNPRTKKNSVRPIMNPRTKRIMILPSKPYMEYQQKIFKQAEGVLFASYDKKKKPTNFLIKPYDSAIEVSCFYVMQDRRRADLIGLEQATWDLLQDLGVVTDDKHILSHGESQILGIRKNDARVSIEIKERPDLDIYKL